jgi:hypothetical protein
MTEFKLVGSFLIPAELIPTGSSLSCVAIERGTRRLEEEEGVKSGV